jgi:predicted RNA-binding protein with RPS1 domain
MPKKASPDANPEQVRDQFLQRVKELWDTHEDEFMQVLDEAESKKINLTFRCSIDKSETAAKLQTGITFSQVVKDAREDVFEDPNQRPLIELPADDKATGKPAGKKGTKSGKGGRQAEFTPPGAEPE